MIPVHGKENVSFEIKELQNEPRVAQTDTCTATCTAAGRRQRYIVGSSALCEDLGQDGVGRKETKRRECTHTDGRFAGLYGRS